MKKTLLKIYNEFIHNIDIYTIILIAIVVGILGVVQLVSFEVISAAILATLGLIATSLLASRKSSDETRSINNQVVDNLEKLLAILYSKPKVGDVFFYGYPDLTAEIRSAKVIKIFSIGMATTIHYYFEFAHMLSNGGSIQILVSDGLSDSLMEVLAFRSSSVRDPQRYRDLLFSTIERAQTLRQYAKDKVNLEFRKIKYYTTFGIFIIENVQHETKIYVQLNAFRTGGSQNPGFVLTTKDNHWFTYFLDQFKNAWDSGEPIWIP
jgi:hypothetical protein